MFVISIPCDAEATYDPDDAHENAVSCTYEACVKETTASQLTHFIGVETFGADSEDVTSWAMLRCLPCVFK